MNNDNTNINGALTGAQQPVGNANAVPNPVPTVAPDTNSAVPNIVADPIPAVVDSNPAVSVPAIDANSVNNQLNADINNIGDNVINQSVTPTPSVGVDANAGGQTINSSLSFETPSVESVAVDTQNAVVGAVGVASVGEATGNEAVAQVAEPVAEAAQPSNNNVSNDGVVSFGKYLGYLFLFTIPLVGLIMLIVKICDKKDKNIGNLAKAVLCYSLIVTAVSAIFTFLSFSSIAAIIGSSTESSPTYNYSDYDANIIDSSDYNSITDNSDYNSITDNSDSSATDDSSVTDNSDSSATDDSSETN